MPPPVTPPHAPREWRVVALIVVAALAAAIPGSHLLALWMPNGPAILLSHGVGLALLAVAVWGWRARRWAPRAGA